MGCCSSQPVVIEQRDIQVKSAKKKAPQDGEEGVGSDIGSLSAEDSTIESGLPSARSPKQESEDSDREMSSTSESEEED